MPNCCDDYGNCKQGRDCPVRAGYSYRKVRAGKPVDEAGCLPVEFTKEQLDAWKQEEAEEWDLTRTEWAAITLALAVVFMIGWIVGRSWT